MRRLLRENRLHEHQASPAETGAQIGLADRHLADAAVPGLSTDASYGCAYNAVLVLGRIVLACAGYRVSTSRPGHHATTFEAVAAIMGRSQKNKCAYFDICRRKRHTLQYDAVGGATKTEAGQLLKEAHAFRKVVLSWMAKNHPHLLS